MKPLKRISEIVISSDILHSIKLFDVILEAKMRKRRQILVRVAGGWSY